MAEWKGQKGQDHVAVSVGKWSTGQRVVGSLDCEQQGWAKKGLAGWKRMEREREVKMGVEEGWIE